MRRRWLLLAVILSAPSGCDNVKWGGVDVRLQAPTARTVQAPEPAQDTAAAALPALPSGPLLLAGTREGGMATLAVVGEVRGEGLAALPTDEETPGFLDHLRRTRFPPGTELVLFSEGVRVGRLSVTRSAADSSTCRTRAQVTGVVELVPGASEASRFLALHDSAALDRPWGGYRVEGTEYDQRAASIAMATEAIRQAGAEWPTSLVESRGDIQAFRMADAPGPSVAASFLLRDRLGVGEPGAGGWTLFVLGTAQGGGYGTAYAQFRRAADGKSAPRFFAHMDWDGDGDSEILLDVFGARSRWFEALGQRGGTWAQTFQDPCAASAR